jgi:hypothetical protein
VLAVLSGVGAAGLRVGGGCGWVEHNVWFVVVRRPFVGGGGSARCWVLRRHPALVGVFFLAAPGLGRLTLRGVAVCGAVGVVVVDSGRGVVVC